MNLLYVFSNKQEFCYGLRVLKNKKQENATASGVGKVMLGIA
jgi:hypothetical protein